VLTPEHEARLHAANRKTKCVIVLAIGFAVVFGIRSAWHWYTGDPDGVVRAFLKELREQRVDSAYSSGRGAYLDSGRARALVARNPQVFGSHDWSVTDVDWSYGGGNATGSATASIVGLDGKTYSIWLWLTGEGSDMGPYPISNWGIAGMDAVGLSSEPPRLYEQGDLVEKLPIDHGVTSLSVSFQVFGLDARWTGRGWTHGFKVTAMFEDEGTRERSVRLVAPSAMPETLDRFGSIPIEIEVDLPPGHPGSRMGLVLTDLVGGRSIIWTVDIPR